jgi:hypothetical protein
MSQYIEGFEDGFEYVIAEIEQYIKQCDPLITQPLVALLAHLTNEDPENQSSIA